MNNGLTQLFKQLQALWKQLGVNQRINVVLAAGMAVAGAAAISYFSSRSDYALLYGKLDGTESGKVIAALEEAKVPYRVTGSGGSIMVPADKVHSMRMSLASKGIPRGEGVGFEIFDKPNFGISDFVQRANYLRAIQGELSRTISQVDSIESARVMVVMPENRLLADTTRKPTASVFVKVRGSATLPAQTVAAIRFLVANAVEGLQSNNVSVVDNSGNVLTENNDTDSLAGLSNTQLSARKNLEQYLSKKAEGMLEKVLGPGQAVVRVSAELNYDSLTRTEEKYDPEGQVIRTNTTNDEDTDIITGAGTPTAAGGAPGTQVNATTETNNVAAASGNKNRTKKKVINNQYEINKVTNQLVQERGGISRLSAAVFINARTEGVGDAKKAAPRTQEELDKLRRIVKSALGAGENGEKRKDEVTLEEMSFNEEPAKELTKSLDKQERNQMLVEVGKTVLYPAAALLILGMFWKAFKKEPSESISAGRAVETFADADDDVGAFGRAGRAGAPPVVTVEVLNQLIKENPDNMMQAVRGWMTRGKPKNN